MTCGQKYAKNITRHANFSNLLFIHLLFQGSIDFMQPRSIIAAAFSYERQ